MVAALARLRLRVAVSALLAAFAAAHVRVTKETGEDRTVATVEVLDDEGRVEELSRMLSGLPDSDTARQHAAELLATVTAEQEGR